MVEFAGWEMPVQYRGVIEEHLAVRHAAGLFDVSHMGEIAVRGRDALSLLQKVTCNDVARLDTGRAQYTALTTTAGTFVDDLLIYRLDDEEYLLVVNAANTEKDFAWLSGHSRGSDVAVMNESDQWAQVALQGPRSLEILEPLAEAPVAEMRSYAFSRTKVAGAPCIVSRTGYTGEDGFEVYAPAEAGERIWESLIRAGTSAGLLPVGLGARDTLRLEARLALYGNDIDETTTVLEADLGFIVKLEKGEFLGREVLARQREQGVRRKLIGFEMVGRPIARHGYAALKDGTAAGTVTSGSFAPFLRRNIGLANLPEGLWEPGTSFQVDIRGRREPAVVVSTPFYRRAR